MFKAVLVMILAVMSSNAMAEWVAVGISEDNTIYIDPSTIRKAGDRVKMWHLYDLKSAKPFPGLEKYLSLKGQAEYDCKQEQVRELYSSAHSENMGWGNIIFRNTDAGEWAPLPPGSGGKIMWKAACERNLKRTLAFK